MRSIFIKTSTKLTIFLLFIIFNFLYVGAATDNTDIDFNYKLTDGTNSQYWVSLDVKYMDQIASGVNRLVYPPGKWNPIYLTQTTTRADSKFDIYQYNEDDRNNAYQMAFTILDMFVINTSQDIIDWDFSRIYLNEYYMDNLYSDTQSAVALHEILHGYGCKDIANPYSIMYSDTPNVSFLTDDANGVLNNKY